MRGVKKTYLWDYEKPARFHLVNADYKIMHSHENYWDFLFVNSGALLHKINGEEVLIKENTICIIRTNDVHSIHNLKGGESSHMNICADVDYLKPLLGNIKEGLYEEILNGESVCFPVSYFAGEEIRRFGNLIFTSGKDCTLLFIKMLLLVFIKEYLLYKHDISAVDEKYSPPVRYLLKALAQSSNYALTTQELFQQTHYSYSRVNNLFSKEVGMTFSQYFSIKKLDYAKRLLANTDTKLSDIAFAVGYSTYAHFAAFFKKRTGQTPTEYVKNHRSGTYAAPIKSE